MSVYKVPVNFLPDIWPSIEGFARKTMALHPFMDERDIYTLVQSTHLTLFIALDAKGAVLGFAGVEVVQYPSRLVANVLAAGGRSGFLASVIDELYPAIVKFAKEQGATGVALSGRPGWLRALRRLGGSSQQYIIMWADINESGRRINQDNHDPVETGTAVLN